MSDNKPVLNETSVAELVKQADEASRPRLEELLATLIELLSGPPDGDELRDLPQLSAAELERALQRLDDAGWNFDEEGRLRRKGGPASDAEKAVFEELQARCPALPLEIGELVWAVMTGNEPREAIVGDASEVAGKRRAVARYVITEELRERFFLRHCSKVSRFLNLDWEVVIKQAERGIVGAPRFPYVLATLNAVSDLHGEHQHETVRFVTGMQGLQKLIDELTVVRDELQRAVELTRDRDAPGGEHA